MIIIPAIDLKDGNCVRLSQGEMNSATIYSSSPWETAKIIEDSGAERLHIVDLDGAVSGLTKNFSVIEKIRNTVSMKIEVGGGIRNIETIKTYLETGVDYAILGTSALKDPVFLNNACRRFKGKIIVGIDAKNGFVAVQGWTETTSVKAVDFADTLDPKSVAALVFTDILRDGMLTGPNIESTAELARSVSIPVIASGGVSGIQDIKNLLKVNSIFGVIIGRAIYTGSIDLAECINLVKTD